MIVAKEIDRVGFEVDDFKAFDDVAVCYAKERQDGTGCTVRENYFQVKFSTTYAKCITADALADPAFINASSVSLLERLRDAVRKCQSEGRNARFLLISPWRIGEGDVLVDLVDTTAGALRLGALFDGTGPKSKMGKVRESWKEHLKLSSDDELREILRPFCIRFRLSTLEESRRNLNPSLAAADFSLISDLTVTDPYSQLIWKASAARKQWFNADEITELCRAEGLCTAHTSAKSANPPKALGVRTFLRWAENLEDETTAMVCLSHHFSQRHIKDPGLWISAILPELRTFFSREVVANTAIELELQSHSTLAFTSGYLIEPKAGVQVGIRQRGVRGREVWRLAADRTTSSTSEIVVAEEVLGEKDIVACAVGITHDIGPDVRKFLSDQGHAGRLLLISVPKPNATAVSDGNHAYSLAEGIIREIKARRASGWSGPLHLFMSVPNGLAFLLGQIARTLGEIQLYEFDFGGTQGYSKSVLLDPSYSLGSTGT